MIKGKRAFVVNTRGHSIAWGSKRRSYTCLSAGFMAFMLYLIYMLGNIPAFCILSDHCCMWKYIYFRDYISYVIIIRDISVLTCVSVYIACNVIKKRIFLKNCVNCFLITFYVIIFFFYCCMEYTNILFYDIFSPHFYHLTSVLVGWLL